MLALLPLVLGLAPEIAKWIIGSKAETVTQQVVEVVKTITGTTDPNEVEEVLNDPHKALELKVALAKIAADAQAVEANERIETLKAEIGDVGNARAQTVSLAEAHSVISWAAPIISIVIVVGFFGVPLFSKWIGDNIDQIWLGALIAAFANVGNYWLGSSASSKRAQEAVQNVATRSADTVNSQVVEANRNRRATDQPPVVVVPPVVPTPISTPPPVVISPALPVPQQPPAAPTEWKSGPFGGARWQLTPDGVLVEGEASVSRSVGEPVTVRKVWAGYGNIIKDVCGRLGVPAEVVVAVICTESKGRADAVYAEPDGIRASGGLMQVLNTTASEILKRKVSTEDLKDPKLNISAGVAYIHSQKNITDFFDVVLVGAAYNSGGIYPPRQQDKNRFRLRSTGDHLERIIRWYGDSCYVSKIDEWHKI